MNRDTIGPELHQHTAGPPGNGAMAMSAAELSHLMWVISLQVAAARLWLEHSPPRLDEAEKAIAEIATTCKAVRMSDAGLNPCSRDMIESMSAGRLARFAA